MKPTAKYNQRIKNTLDSAGITYKEFGEQIWVNRNSMCNSFTSKPGQIPEEYAYPKTLELIKFVLPSTLYVIWGGKNDDEIFLEVYE
jgi:hypothetical protein